MRSANTKITDLNFDFIDVAKFIGIFLVIFGHIIPTNSNLYYLIGLFHMPLFFVITGFLYKIRDFRGNLLKIFYGLIMPYFWYQVIYFPIKYFNLTIVHHYPFLQTFLKMCIGILIGNNGGNVFYENCLAPAWFIYTMILLLFVLALIKINNKNLFLLTTVSLIFSFIILKNHIFLPFCIGSLFYAFPYFCLGYVLRKVNFNNFIIKKVQTILIVVLGLIFLSFFIKYNGVLFMSKTYLAVGSETNSLLIDYIAGCLGSLLVLLSSKHINKNKFVDVISKNTLFIIFFHWLLLFFIRWVGLIKYLYQITSVNIRVIIVGIITFIILVVSYYMIMILQKYCPILLGKYRPND